MFIKARVLKMIIIIDGYNLLRAMFPKIEGKLLEQRGQLIKSLAIYKKRKGHEILLVFDAGPFGHSSRELHDGVVVIFAGQGKTADDYIVGYVKEHSEKEKLLVSNDKQLRSRCSKYNIDNIDANVFEQKIEDVLLMDIVKELDSKDNVIKYSREGEIENEALDILIEQAGIDSYNKEDFEDNYRNSNSKTRSKKEKRLERKLGKL